MPATGFRSPSIEDSADYIADYIKYKVDKINKLNEQMKKLYKHVQKQRRFEYYTGGKREWIEKLIARSK